MRESRFLLIEDKLHLVIVTYENNTISEVAGPVQCTSDAGVAIPQFISSLMDLCIKATYNKSVLLLSDLPDAVKETITVKK